MFDRVSTFLETLYRDMQKGTRGWEGVGGRVWVGRCGWVYVRLGATPFHCLSLFTNVSAYVHPIQVSVVRMPSL